MEDTKQNKTASHQSRVQVTNQINVTFSGGWSVIALLLGYGLFRFFKRKKL